MEADNLLDSFALFMSPETVIRKDLAKLLNVQSKAHTVHIAS